MRKARSLCLFVITCLGAAPGRGAFLDPNWGARPSGMGGAFVAVSDDANAAFYNPAGAVQADRVQLSFMHAKLFLGLGDDVNLNLNSFTGLVPRKKGLAFGLGWTAFQAPVYREDVGYLYIAQSLERFWPSMTPEIALGATAKFMNTRYDLDDRTTVDPVFAESRSGDVVSFEAGLWSRPAPWALPGLRAGAVARNINRPDVGLYTEDEVRENFAGGLAYDWARFTFAADAVSGRGESSLRAGAEYRAFQRRPGEAASFHRRFAVRAGVQRTAVSTGFTYEFGLAENLGVALDYALSIPFYVEDSDGSHRVAVTMRF